MLRLKYLLDFGSNFIIYFISALVGIVVSRLAGPEVIGTLAFGLSFVQMFFFVFGLFGQSHIKLISEGQNIDDCKKIYSTIIGATAVIFVLIVGINFFVQQFLFHKEYSKTEIIVIVISLLFLTIKGLLKVPQITFTALTQQARINVPKLLRSIIYNLSRLIIVLLGLKAVALASANLLSFLIVIPIYIKLMGKGYLKGKWDNLLFKRYLQIGFPLLVITVSISLMNNYGNVFVKDYSSTTQLGYFTGATSLAAMMIMVGGTAGSLFFPLFSKAYAEKNFSFISAQISKYEHFIFVFVMPIIIAFSVNSYTIITFLLGKEYLPSVIIFSVLIFYSFFKIWTIAYYNLINGVNRYNLNSLLHVIYFGLFFLILYFTVHKDHYNLGGLGLAISFLTVEIIKLISMWIIGNKAIDSEEKKVPRMILLIVFYGVCFLLSYYVFQEFVFHMGLFMRIVYLILLAPLIYMLSFFFKLMTSEDVRFVIEILNIKPLLNYVRKELNED